MSDWMHIKQVLQLAEPGLLTDFCFPRRELLAWYAQNARVLPWRQQPSAYHTWISEIMLQQTRVEAVIPYYLRFLEALPDLPALAAVEPERLLKLWQGLGYYTRARNLQKTAQLLLQNEQGKLPAAPEELKQLPGIGEYTAAAIASIAYGVAVPVLDGNVLRVMARLLAVEAEIETTAVKNALRQIAFDWISREEPGDYNQAMMDLGATVCLPNGIPLCAACPLQAVCLAKRLQRGDLPRRRAKTARQKQMLTVLVIQAGEQFLLQQRSQKGLLAGLWEFPNFPGHLEKDEIWQLLEDRQSQALGLEALPSGYHLFTHIEWEMSAWKIRVSSQKGAWPGVWATREEITNHYAIPNAFAFLLQPLLQQTEEKC
ncbi:MAG: A/G-specific adenine glycosylase [Negativicutes bacterium]|nr:A/G-specific adenine glycosylase [Negativicutes bacterium]